MMPPHVRGPLCLACLVSVPALGQANHESDTTRFRTEVVATGLKQPTAMVFLPDGRAVLLERQSARIGLIDMKSGALTMVSGGPEALTGAESGVHDRNRPTALTGEDSGLHDVVLHPDYARNGWLYISFSDGLRERSTTAIDRYRLQGTRLVDHQRVFTADAWSEDRFHYGGRMVFKDGYLYVTIGDRHHQDRAQELDNHAGKILRLDADGRAPPDNPFVGNPEARPEIWSYGHRNPQGLAVNPETGELWSDEHGPMHGDELNVIRRGGNYGWPIISYGWQYSGGPMGQGITRQDGLEQPLWVWTPAIAPSGLVFYTGTQFPTWRGSVFVGAMGQRHLNRLRVRDGRVAVEERLLNRQVGRVRLVAQDPAGFLYLGTDDGQLLRLQPVQ